MDDTPTTLVLAPSSMRVASWPRYDGRATDIVVAADAFERDLGMPHFLDVVRQLHVDLPRSTVLNQWGYRLCRPEAVVASTSHSRCCTQAVFAPVVEWFLHSDVTACTARRSDGAMRADVRAGGDVTAAVSFYLREYDAEVRVAVEASRAHAVVSVSDPQPVFCLRTTTTNEKKRDVPYHRTAEHGFVDAR